MRKFIISVGMVLIFATYALAQYQYFGPTVKHRTAVATADNWFATMQKSPTSDSVELRGYNSVRIDADITNGATVVCNLGCSNDSIWVSGDALTFTRDSYQDVDLQGCADFHVNIDSISTGTIDIYLTPFNK